MSTPTILDILTRRNPDIIDVWDGKSYKNTESSKRLYDGVVFDETCDCTIQDWQDFTYEAIHLAYGDILDKAVTAERVRTPTRTPLTVAEESHIDSLGEAWTCNIIRNPIKIAGAVIRPRLAGTADMATDPSLGSFRIKWTIPGTNTDVNPDWAILDRRLQKRYREEVNDEDAMGPRDKNVAFVVGDSKMWQKWQAEWIHKRHAKGYTDKSPAVPLSGPLQNKRDVTSQRLKPLEQVATYCRFAETRYAYILTQKELVAFRFRRVDSTELSKVVAQGKLHAVLEYKAIPWTASGSGKLTMHLAIWALGCMGMNDEHREMEAPGNRPLNSMVRLTKWTHDKTKKLYRNDISGRVITEAKWNALTPGIHNFVQLDDDPRGISLTSSFIMRSPVPNLTQAMQQVSLNPSGTANRKPPPPFTVATASGSGSKPAPTPGSAAPPGKATGSPPKTTSSPPPPAKYVIEGEKGPGSALDASNGKHTFESKTVQWDDAKKKWYFTGGSSKKPKKTYLKRVS